jgi:hypothetical protein
VLLAALLPGCALIFDVGSQPDAAFQLDGAASQTDAQGSPDAPTTYDAAACSGVKRVFATTQTFQGTAIGGLEQADEICATEAAGLGVGDWLAWLSDGAMAPDDRFAKSASCYVRAADGLVIASSWDDLTDGMLDRTPGITLNMQSVDRAWTNVRSDGTADGQNDCGEWAGLQPSEGEGSYGQLDAIDSSAWSATGLTVTCNFPYPLLCFEQ